VSDDVVFDVRAIVARIPPGHVLSYGDIAELVAIGPRQVGRIMSLYGSGLPWHRVVRSDGTPAGCHGGEALRLLLAEGTPVRGSRVDMRAARASLAPERVGDGDRDVRG
jgi:alkylated DNA nucleotide flippase Atl1